ncbi:dCTP deaminase [Sorangium sp. So ce1182]|uniref:dCTP deaminase n=1 Tax=Sorangium sp. So ce1182 TaxID=3133334 RepID=UPI003F5EAD27
MTMLGGELIRQAMSMSHAISERLVIVPFFSDSLQIDGDAASIDLRLGPRFAIAKQRRLTHNDPYSERPSRAKGRFDEHYVPIGDYFVVHPGHFVLATTLEWLRLPMNIGAYVVGKSTLGRYGLSITNGAGVQPGFAGTLTLELANVADVPIRMVVGQPVCQVFFHDVRRGRPGDVAEGAKRARYICSKRPVIGRLEVDDIDRFLGVGPEAVESATRWENLKEAKA